METQGFKHNLLITDHPARRRIYYHDPEGNDWEFVEYRTTDPAQRNDTAMLPDADAALAAIATRMRRIIRRTTTPTTVRWHLAMHGLASMSITSCVLRRRTAERAPSPPTLIVSDATWQQQQDPAAYSALLVFRRADCHKRLASDGHKFLPTLISGWVKDAFHPLIRLGYGIGSKHLPKLRLDLRT
jgi:hypothetical protein